MLDQYDDTLPLLPLVVWDRHLPEKYEAKWGEALLPRLSDLFGPKTDENAQTRCRFFATTSEMYENAYFKQLGDWCENAGLSFSGHVLLEEEILHHPLFEGNILFYGKSGFDYASKFGIRYNDLPEDADSSFFLCRELIPGYLDGVTGVYQTPAGYYVDERDVDEFDRSFPPKEKLKLPGQLFG